MSHPATFDEDDWRGLTPADKKAVRTFGRVTVDFAPLSKASGVGQASMDSLMAKNLAVEGPPFRHGDRQFKLTDKGWLAVEWLHGRRR